MFAASIKEPALSPTSMVGLFVFWGSSNRCVTRLTNTVYLTTMQAFADIVVIDNGIQT
jgi:hypothetical protein